jgi:hypothetical protein
MEWIESSQVLLGKEKTGKPSQNQAIDILVFSSFYGEGPGFESQPAHHIFQQLLRFFSVFYGFVLFEVGENIVAPSVWIPPGDVTSPASSGWSIIIPERLTMTVALHRRSS